MTFESLNTHFKRENKILELKLENVVKQYRNKMSKCAVCSLKFFVFSLSKENSVCVKIQIDFIVRVWWGTLIFSILPVRSYAMEHCFSFNNFELKDVRC